MLREHDLFTAKIAQGAPGTTEVIAAPPAWAQIMVYSYTVVLALAGTFKWNDGTDDLSGAMDAVLGGGSAPSGFHPVLIVPKGRPLKIITSIGAANGHLVYEIR